MIHSLKLLASAAHEEGEDYTDWARTEFVIKSLPPAAFLSTIDQRYTLRRSLIYHPIVAIFTQVGTASCHEENVGYLRVVYYNADLLSDDPERPVYFKYVKRFPGVTVEPRQMRRRNFDIIIQAFQSAATHIETALISLLDPRIRDHAHLVIRDFWPNRPPTSDAESSSTNDLSD